MAFEPFLTPQEIEALQIAEKESDKKRKRTEQQIEAIYTHGQNVLVSASAGSGKTFVMVERIIDKIKRGVEIEQLFISTFTVKAAGELKNRLEEKLSESLAETQDQDLQRHLAQQIANLPNADIGTMDAFTQKLVSQYGYLLGLSPQFRILQDASEQDILKNEVYASLFEAYMSSEQSDLFRALVRNFTGQSKSSKNFRAVVYHIHTFSQSTSSPKKWLEDTFLKGYDHYKDFSSLPDAMIDAIRREMHNAADALVDVTNLEDYKKTKKDGKETAAYLKHKAIFENLYEWSRDFSILYGKENLADLAQDVLALLPATGELTVAKVKYPIFKTLQSQLNDLKHLSVILSYQSQALPILQLLQAFVLDFSERYLQRKRDENAFEFSDIGHFAIQILEDNQSVRDSYQAKYHEVMVDEYQDNNHTQERLLDLLSNGQNRFMVGDIKQSIYRFRQADPQIFNQKFKQYQKEQEAGKLILLKENFRSHQAVLNATNAIFTRLMDEEVGEIDYDERHRLLAGHPDQLKDEPDYEAEFLIYNTDQEDGEDNATLSSGEIDLVIKEIIKLHQKGVAFDDITLLVPSRTRNDMILRAFEEHGIPLVSDGGEQNYLKSVEVLVLLDTLRTIDNPLNDYALVALLRSPMFAFTEDDLARIALQGHQEEPQTLLYDKLELALAAKGQHPQLIGPELFKKIENFKAYLTEWRRFAKTHSLYDLIWKIYNERFYYDYVGALSYGEKRQANLYALALRANQFEKTGFKGLSRFIRMIDKLLASEHDLADVEVFLPKNAVRLMTVHKSKGLEFQYVFLLNSDKKFNNLDSRGPVILSRTEGIGIKYLADMKADFPASHSYSHLYVSMDTLPYQMNKRALKLAAISEQMRLLYVALTRAEKKLYIVGKGSKEKLADKFDGKSKDGKLLAADREAMTSFQDWILAIMEAFRHQELPIKQTYVTDSDLTQEKIGQLKREGLLEADDLAHNRQSDVIKKALESLDKVSELNQQYQAAINLPTLRTPSQLKKPLIDEEVGGFVQTMPTDQSAPLKPLQFQLPDFSQKPKVTAAQIGSAVHQLMQVVPLKEALSLSDLEEALALIDLDEQVKKGLHLEKILAIFSTDLGKRLVKEADKVYREAPFAMLEKDDASGEQFIIRGIIDGYLLLDDEIILFDYKTDRYHEPEELKKRYQDQMNLYAKALSKSYNVAIDKVSRYLILLGGDQVRVLDL